MNSKRKTTKIISITLLSLIVAGWIGWELLKEFKIKAFVVDNIQAELNHYFEDSVHFKIKDIEFQFNNKSLLLHEVHVDLLGTTEDTIASLSLPTLSFSWDEYLEAFNSEYFRFDSVSLDQVTLMLPLDFKKIRTTKASRPSFDGKFELQLDRFIIKDGGILFYDNEQDEPARIQTKYNLNADNLYFKKGEIPKGFSDVADEIFLEFHDFSFLLKNNLHAIDIEKLRIDLFEKDIFLKSVHYKPLLSHAEYAKLKEEESNYIDFEVDSLYLSNFSFQVDSSLTADSIWANAITLQIRKDKNYPLPYGRYVPVLIDELRKSDLNIDLRETKIKKLDLFYYETPNRSEEQAVLELNEVYATITNISNNADSMAKYGTNLEINLQGKLYGEGKIDAKIRYKLDSKYGYFTVRGNAGPMPLKTVNQYLMKTTPVEVLAGNVDHIFFSFSGGSKACSGEMEFRYSDLEIEFDKVFNEDKKGDKLATFAGNIFLPSQNPRKSGRLRVGKIEFTRDTRKSMFSYWTGGLVSGFKSSLGMEKPARIEKIKEEKPEEKSVKGFFRKLGNGKSSEE